MRIRKQHHLETAHRDQLFTQTYAIDEELVTLSESAMALVCVNRKLDGKAVSRVAVDTHLALTVTPVTPITPITLVVTVTI